MLSKRFISLLIALTMLVGLVIIPASADKPAEVRLECSDLTVGIGEVAIISASVSDGADCQISFISTTGAAAIGETVYNEVTHVSSATVTGITAGQDIIIAAADGSYGESVCTVAVTEAVEDGKFVNHTLYDGTASAGDNTSPAAEVPAKAFDNSVDTKWLVFTDTCWLQYHFNNDQRFIANAYVIASANDDAIRDPVDWEILGSNDGANWKLLDTRSGEEFASRKLKRTFYMKNAEAFSYYRINITKNNGDTRIQLSEFQLLEYGKPESAIDLSTLPNENLTNLTLNPGTIQVEDSNSPSAEQPVKAFDNSVDSKWLVMNNTCWIQYHFNQGSYAANAYMIASANDDSVRDPKVWEILGSNDGENWDVLDRRENEDFGSRKLKRYFLLDNTNAYSYYRFDIIENHGDDKIQISEFQLISYSNAKSSIDLNFIPSYQRSDLTVNPGTVLSGNGTSPADGQAINAFDDSFDTKWSVSGNSGWLQYKFNNDSYAASAYAITSANTNVVNYCIGATATASSFNSGVEIPKAIDGDPSTRWSSSNNDNQWYMVDFGEAKTFNTVYIQWETAHSKDYVLQVSDDGVNFTDVLSEPNCPGGTEIRTFDTATGRYIRISMGGRTTKYGHSFFEFGVYNTTPDTIGLISDNTLSDPKAWEVLGSDDGENWDVLDTRSGEKFASRKLTKYYTMGNEREYSYYRLNVLSNNGDTTLQLAEFDLISILADKSELNELIAKANAVDTTALSSASAQMLSTTLAYAESVSSVKYEYQGKIDAAAATLNKALDTIVTKLALNASADKDEYLINETITLSIATTTDVSRICLYNENGRYVAALTSDYADEGSIRNWTVTTSVGSKGSRTISIFAKDSSDAIVDTGLTVSFNVIKGVPAPAIIEATMLTASPVKVNETFNIEVITTTTVDKVCIANENGKYIVNTASYVDNGSTRTWSIALSVGTAGNRSFTIGAKSNSVMLDNNLNLSIIVTK